MLQIRWVPSSWLRVRRCRVWSLVSVELHLTSSSALPPQLRNLDIDTASIYYIWTRHLLLPSALLLVWSMYVFVLSHKRIYEDIIAHDSFKHQKGIFANGKAK